MMGNTFHNVTHFKYRTNSIYIYCYISNIELIAYTFIIYIKPLKMQDLRIALFIIGPLFSN